MKTRLPQVINWVCRVILAGMFFYTGYIKIEINFFFEYPFVAIEPSLQFAYILAGYELFPEDWILYIAQWFPWVEIALGVFLLIGWKIRFVAAAATALLLAFIVVLSITYFRGIDTSCGCFNFTDKVSPLTILRDNVILIPALYLLFEPVIVRKICSKR